MTTITATIQGGRLEVDAPAEWPDGTRVEIHAINSSRDDDIRSPEEIATVLAAIDAMEPVEMTAEERAAWHTDREARKKREKDNFMKHADELRRLWE